MHPEFEAGEILNNPPRFEGAGVDGRLGTQLSQNTDIHAARGFFEQASGGARLPDLQIGIAEAAPGGHELPSLNLSGGTGAEAAVGNALQVPGAETALMPGMEQGLLGLEQGALAGMPPGSEPISPLVQMILKMPGLTGIIGDFFSALMAFFFPADGGFLTTLLNPAMWAAATQHAFTSFAQILVHDLPLTLTTMGTNNPLQNMLQQGLMSGTKTAAAGAASSPVTLSLEHQPFLNSNTMDVGGYGPGNSMYEMSSLDSTQFADGGAINVDVSPNKFIAMEGGNSFGPTIGGSQVPTAQMTQTAPMTTQTVPSAYQQPALEQPAQTQPMDAGADRGTLLQNGTTGNGTEIATTGDAAPAHHMVTKGDNLWDIAKEHLGSGTRWGEIYELNKTAIGNNPSLIYSGTDLQLPAGADNVASGAGNYMVKSGDNLWNIARDHMGGGKNWHSLYDQNAGVIGSNPDLIHPGQNLAVPDSTGASMQVAHNTPAVHHSAPVHHAPAAHHAPAHHAPAAPSHTAHHPTTNTAHHAAHGADKVAHHAKPAAHHDGGPGAAEGATTESITTASNEMMNGSDMATQANTQANQAAATKMEELGKTAHAPEDLKQELVGLKAVAKSL